MNPITVTVTPTRRGPGSGCHSGCCATFTEDAVRGGFTVTSTVYPGGQFLDYAEVASLADAIESGELAPVFARARAQATVSV